MYLNYPHQKDGLDESSGEDLGKNGNKAHSSWKGFDYLKIRIFAILKSLLRHTGEVFRIGTKDWRTSNRFWKHSPAFIKTRFVEQGQFLIPQRTGFPPK